MSIEGKLLNIEIYKHSLKKHEEHFISRERSQNKNTKNQMLCKSKEVIQEMNLKDVDEIEDFNGEDDDNPLGIHQENVPAANCCDIIRDLTDAEINKSSKETVTNLNMNELVLSTCSLSKLDSKSNSSCKIDLSSKAVSEKTNMKEGTKCNDVEKKNENQEEKSSSIENVILTQNNNSIPDSQRKSSQQSVKIQENDMEVKILQQKNKNALVPLKAFEGK